MSSPLTAERASRSARARAHANIALAKYWGKADASRNLPAVPSLSLTLAELSTTTEVSFDPSAPEDSLRLNGVEASGADLARVVPLLDRVRDRAGIATRARVCSDNDFPTASGLASSASGFAALALAGSAAAGLSLTPNEVSELARASSVSAARSVHAGFATLEAGASYACPLEVPASALELVMVVAITSQGPKAVGSTRGMLHTQETSPYHAAWVEDAQLTYLEALEGLLAGDFEQLGRAMEHSTLAMHASMLAARPALRYLNAASLNVIERVEALRREAVFAYFTMDAGPHVKVLTQSRLASAVASALEQVPGVQRVLVARPGPAARVLGT